MPAVVGRERELERLQELLARARAGRGGVAVLEGPAGIGKTALLAEVTRRAESLGFSVLKGGGARLEHEYAFGVVRQLFAPLVAVRSGAEDLFDGAARLAEIPLGLVDRTSDLAEASGDASAAMHGLFWLTSNLSERTPLLVAVDDAHLGDAMSLRFALYLGRRIDDLAVLLALVSRPLSEQADNELLVQFGALPGLMRLRPAPLTEPDVGRVIEQNRLHNPDEQFVSACYRATGGNPFLLGELLASLVAGGVSGSAADAQRVEGFAPEGIVRWVLVRLGALTQDAQRLADAFSVLGAAPLTDAATLADVGPSAAAAAGDELVAAHILSAGRGYGFAHPVLQAAVYDGLGPARRAALHAHAARLSSARGAPLRRVAAHLLASDPGHDGWTVDVLRAAAREAGTSGAPASAISYLKRALAETQAPETRADVLLELGEALLQAGLPGATDRLQEALELDIDSRRRAKILLTLGRALFSTGEYLRARDALRRGLAELPTGDDLSLELSGWSIALARDDAGLPPVTQRRLRSLLDGDAPGETRDERLLLVHLAYEAVRSGARRSDEVARLARRALADGELLKDSAPDVMGPYGGACYALLYAGEIDAAMAALGRGIELSQRQGSRVAFGRLSRLRGVAHYFRGDLVEALADLDSARTTHSDGYEHGLPETLAFLALCALDHGDPAGAAALLELPGDAERWRVQPSFASFLFAAGRVCAAQGALDEGLAALLECEQLVRETNSPNPAVNLPWRSEAALLAARLGARDRAEALAAEELALAGAFGAPRPLGVALRVAGLLSGRDGLEQLAEAEALLEQAGNCLELARTLTDHGASLRRAGRRRDAREPLRRALDLATQCGALAITRRAREELIAAGAKPRRERISGLQALTASELRVAQLAAEGLTNRQIAQSLFITMRTVSAHLGHAYAKLDIGDRAQLATALRVPGPSPGDDDRGAPYGWTREV
ncbi:MAG: AAA family ATPase [Solirubrobacterales bacterium]|nr:AAA family ATPase [Solirubrobacterales bacterium]